MRNNSTDDLIKQLNLGHKIVAYNYMKNELDKSKKRLEKQINKKKSKLNSQDETVMVYKRKFSNGTTEDCPICNKDDLLELWQNDVITNERIYEKYERKLDELLKTSESEKIICENQETYNYMEKFINNLAYEIHELEKEYEKIQEGA